MKPPFIKIPRHVDAGALYAAAERLEQRIKSKLPEVTQELSAIPSDPSGYWGEWFSRKIPNVLSYLQVYAYIIANALPDKRLSEIRMLDFGAGWGLMGMLAKEAGIGSVSYLDIHPGIANAVQKMSAIVLPLDEYICGSEEALIGRATSFDAVVSSDALEHVYRPDNVFRAIAGICVPGAVVFHHTGANPRCIPQRITLTKIHRAEEPKLREIRRAVLAEHGVNSEALAIATRGLDRTDLLRAIDVFKTTGAMPTPDHPTNTCELSGYWLERLMNPYEVAAKMGSAGFETRVMQSFWGPGRSGTPARILKHALNFASRLSVPIGLRVTFYYGIHGVRRG